MKKQHLFYMCRRDNNLLIELLSKLLNCDQTTLIKSGLRDAKTKALVLQRNLNLMETSSGTGSERSKVMLP